MMWGRRIGFPTFTFFMIGFVAVMLAWFCGLLKFLF
jgi:hypothetical protein